MEAEEIIEKIDGFLDKQGLALESKEKVTRIMAERYWEDIKLEDEVEPEDEPDEFNVPEEVPEEANETPKEEIKPPKPTKKEIKPKEEPKPSGEF